jgi:hypothetical protein
MLAGRPPFEATSPHHYLVLHSKETHFEPLQLPANLPGGEELQGVMRRALEHDRNKRYATAREWITALESVERALPPPFDAEATMRVTPAPAPLQTGTETIAATQRAPFYTPSPRATVAATPAPAPLAPPTVIEPLPPPKPWRSVAIGAIVLLIAIGAIAVAYLRSKPADVELQTPASTGSVAIAPSQPATSTFDVVNTSTSPVVATVTTEAAAARPAVTATHATETRAAVEPPPAPVPRSVREDKAAAEPEPVSPSSAGRVYTEGGDGDANDAALEELRRAVSGASTIGVSGGAMSEQLMRTLQKSVSGVSFTPGNADVTIHFEGTLERRGMGRKRRAAHATITKGGRTVFRYDLPSEDYRIGDDPVEAFARAVSDSLR